MRLSLLLGAVVAVAAAVACSSSSSPGGGGGGNGDASASSSSGSSSGSGGSSGSASSSSGSSSSGSSSGSVADGGDTWDTWAQGFFTKYCVECHAVGNSAGLDFGQHSIVTTNADVIRCGVCVTQDPSWSCPASPAAKQFPISDTAGTNPKPTDDERNRAVAWITAGTP